MSFFEEIKKETQDRMQKAFHYIEDKIKKVRTGSAHAGLLEGVKVSCYGQEQDLKHIASISCPDARSLVISPWDQNILKDIEQALVKSNLGMAPIRETRLIRLKVPELTEETRQDLIKAFKKDVEKSRVEFRQIRKIINDKIKKAFKDKQISEDSSKDYEKEVQKMTDEFITKVNEISDKKQQELMKV